MPATADRGNDTRVWTWEDIHKRENPCGACTGCILLSSGPPPLHCTRTLRRSERSHHSAHVPECSKPSNSFLTAPQTGEDFHEAFSSPGTLVAILDFSNSNWLFSYSSGPGALQVLCGRGQSTKFPNNQPVERPLPRCPLSSRSSRDINCAS